MATLSIARTIHAPTAFVFKTVADPTQFRHLGGHKNRVPLLDECALSTRLECRHGELVLRRLVLGNDLKSGRPRPPRFRDRTDDLFGVRPKTSQAGSK